MLWSITGFSRESLELIRDGLSSWSGFKVSGQGDHRVWQRTINVKGDLKVP
jgi:hypothetical protein